MEYLRNPALKLIFITILVFLVVLQPTSAVSNWSIDTVAISQHNTSTAGSPQSLYHKDWQTTNISYSVSLDLDPSTGEPRIAWGGFNPEAWGRPLEFSWATRDQPAGTDLVFRKNFGSLNYAEYNRSLNRWNNTVLLWSHGTVPDYNPLSVESFGCGFNCTGCDNGIIPISPGYALTSPTAGVALFGTHRMGANGLYNTTDYAYTWNSTPDTHWPHDIDWFFYYGPAFGPAYYVTTGDDTTVLTGEVRGWNYGYFHPEAPWMNVSRSTDFGATWTTSGRIDAPGIVYYVNPQYIGSGEVIAMASSQYGTYGYSTVVKSTNGGVTWSNSSDPKEPVGSFDTTDPAYPCAYPNGWGEMGSSGDGIVFYTVEYRYQVNGTLIEYGVRRSTDYGETWSSVFPKSSTFTLWRYSNLGGTGAIAAARMDGVNGLAKTDDDGDTWYFVGPSGGYYATGYVESGIALASQDGKILRSTDYGETWSTTAVLTGVRIASFAYLQNGVVMAGSIGGGIFVSRDYGLTWDNPDQCYCREGWGYTPSLKINSSGYARIASERWDAPPLDPDWAPVPGHGLYYTSENSHSLGVSSWNTTNVYTTPTFGGFWFPSLALNATGWGRILGYPSVYFSNTGGSTWATETLPMTISAEPGSLALSVTGDPRIASNRSWPDFSMKVGATWYNSPIDNAFYTSGQSISLALDPYSEDPRVSYYNDTGNSLRYSEWNGTAWNSETVDNSSSDVGRVTSLAIDRWQRPHIAYLDSANKNLKYAVRDFWGVWHKEVVDSMGSNPWIDSSVLSLALGPPWDSGRIAYSVGESTGDAENRYLGTLKFASSEGLEYFTGNVLYGYVSSTGGGLESGATVHISNSTWNSTTDSGNDGLYAFWDLLPEETYTLQATKPSFGDSPNYGVNSSFPGAFVRQDLVLGPAQFNLNLYIRDAEDLSLMVNKTVAMETTGILTTTAITTSGQYTFTNLPYGTLGVTFTSSGYRPQTWSFPMTGDRTETIYLEREQSSSYQHIFYPHQVRLICQDPYGIPLSGVGVNVKGYNTTYANASWWQNIFGVDLSETNLFETMGGPTASDGSIVFLMSESIYYVIDLTYGSYTQQLTVYPKEDSYLIIMTPPGSVPFSTTNGTININYELSSNEVSTTQMDLRLNYTDSSSATTSISFWVDNSSRGRIWSQTYSGSTVSAMHSVDTTSMHGESIYYGFFANHINAGNLTQMKTVTIRSRLVELGLDDNAYTWISIILLVLFTALFSGITSREGYILVPLIASFMWYIGWLNIGYAVMSAAIILGLLLYITKTQAVSEG